MRNAMLATSAQLARLLLRMNRLSHSARYNEDGTIVSAENARWTVGNLDPPSPLLEGMRGKTLVVATTRLLDEREVARLDPAGTGHIELRASKFAAAAHAGSLRKRGSRRYPRRTSFGYKHTL
jgi:hypothetical protein